VASVKNVFISYRRDDSAGHAGRLQDALTERLGDGRVFMDVSDLQPGQDYVAALDAALAHADCVLAVIGPRWLTAADAAGQRRIDEPGDLVSREIGAGLSRSATVIPVLVHGATMPAAEALPPALRALARRQAIVLSDQRWDRDVEELARLLSAGEQVPAAARAPRGGRTWVAPVVVPLLVLALAAVAVGAWMKWPSASRPDAPVAAAPSANGQAPAARAEAKPAPAAPRSTAAPPQRFAVALPKVSEVRFRTHRAQLRVSILAIRQEPRDGGSQTLALLVRMTNSGPADEAFNSEQFRLIAGEQTIAPTATLIDLTDAVTAKETTLDFVLPAGVMEPVLEIRVNDEKTRIPIALSARTPMANDASLDDFGQPRRVRVVDAVEALPAQLAAGQRVEVGKLGYQIVEAVIDRETMEKASLTLTVRCTMPRALGPASSNFWSNTVRLWIDGVPRPPVNAVNEIVGPGESKEARFVFDLLALPQSLEVGIVSADDSAKVALSLEPVLKR
jgi:TIR domain